MAAKRLGWGTCWVLGREVDQGVGGREVEVCGGSVVGVVLADGPRPREVRSCEPFRDGVAGWEYQPGSF